MRLFHLTFFEHSLLQSIVFCKRAIKPCI